MAASGLQRLVVAAKTPLYAISALTAAKSFIGNPVLGSRRLNEIGLRAARVRIAARLGAFRDRLGVAPMSWKPVRHMRIGASPQI